MNTGRDMRVFSSNSWGLIRQAGHKPPYPAGMPKPRPVDQQDFIDLDRRRNGYQADEPQVNTASSPKHACHSAHPFRVGTVYARGLGGDSGGNPPWTSLAAEQTASLDEVPSSHCPLPNPLAGHAPAWS